MNAAASQSFDRRLSWRRALFVSAIGIASFHLAYCFPPCGFLIAVFLWSLFELTRLGTSRQAFYFGLAVAFLAYAPQLSFIWTIFGAAAIPLWLVLSFWVGLFVLLGRHCRVSFKHVPAVLLIPFLWTGLEYFRSELYYLRFSWLNSGYVFANGGGLLPLHLIGMYGVGFILMTLICVCSRLSEKRRWLTNVFALAVFAIITDLPAPKSPAPAGPVQTLQVAGVQREFPNESGVIFSLKQLVKKYPAAQLLVMSEYTFEGPVPQRVLDWCKTNRRYLAIGGKDPAPDSKYYNTVFVIGPDGDIVFRQAKSVPIQFFADGLPAKKQEVWQSPWGNIGFCICYDLSYSRVTDQLVRLGAQAIIVPTMDVAYWGARQHEMHARVAPIRSMEYGVPIFRVASSGISQCVTTAGKVVATAPLFDDGAMLSGTLSLAQKGSLPWDRIVAPICVGVTSLTICWLIIMHMKLKHHRRSKPAIA